MMNTTHPTALAAKIAARNHVHALRNSVAPMLQEVLRPLVGTKVCNVGGELNKRTRDLLRAVETSIDGTVGMASVYVSASPYNITARFKVCHGHPMRDGRGEYAEYAESVAYLGELSNGVLTKLVDGDDARTDYTEAEVLAARQELAAAQKALSAAQSKLNYFGEYDR